MPTHRHLLTFLLAWLMVCIPVIHADGPSKEYQIKAAFIYNFTQFIEWPADSFADSNSPLVVAVVGNDPFEGALQQAFAGKLADTRHVIIQYFATANDVGACHLLFVPSAEVGSLSTILRRLDGAAILTVGESEGFTAAGGGICFYTENNKIRFEVNLDATQKARLKISSKLLKLARIYTK